MQVSMNIHIPAPPHPTCGKMSKDDKTLKGLSTRRPVGIDMKHLAALPPLCPFGAGSAVRSFEAFAGLTFVNLWFSIPPTQIQHSQTLLNLSLLQRIFKGLVKAATPGPVKWMASANPWSAAWHWEPPHCCFAPLSCLEKRDVFEPKTFITVLSNLHSAGERLIDN